jgi:uncharacterized protein YggE
MKKITTISVLLVACLSLKAQNLVPNPYPKTISVTGSAQMEIVPDEIYVQVDLKEYRKKNEKTELETIKTNFLNTCKAIGIPDSLVSIASYTGYNNSYWNWRKKRKDPDMYATISYQVKFKESKKMDELVDRLDDEAVSNFQIVRTSHSRIQEFRRQLKIEAVKAAKDKATYLTESISEKLGYAVTISEPEDNSNTYSTQNMVSNFSLREYKTRDNKIQLPDDTAIDFNKIQLKYDVAITFALK